MKALLITGYGKINDNVEMSNINKPTINDNQVLIEVHAAGINPIDYKTVEGQLRIIKKLDLPSPFGFDVSGTVVQKGSKVIDLRIGDEVYSRVSTDAAGTFAEYCVADRNLVALKPTNITFEEAAGLPLVGLTAMQSLETAQLNSGHRVLIHAGSGGIGTFAIQFAKSKGAYVYTTTSTKNVHWVDKLGADRVIDYKNENYLDIVKDVDIVLDTLGRKYTAEAFKVIKKGGKVVTVVGDPDNETMKELGINPIFRFFINIKRWKIDRAKKKKSAFYKFVSMDPNGSQLEEITRLVEGGEIIPVVDTIYPFEEAISALEHQKTGRAQGKIILKMK